MRQSGTDHGGPTGRSFLKVPPGASPTGEHRIVTLLPDPPGPGRAARAERSGRTGTSIRRFLELFPDSNACLEHVFRSRFGEHPPCPGCGSATGWYRVANTTGFAPRCCYKQRLFPLKDTLFAQSRVPLHKWFYAILHFCNAGTGIGVRFLARHLGLSTEAAVRMADRIRRHFHALGLDLSLGGKGQQVYVFETRLRNVIDSVPNSRTSIRILIISDGKDFAVIPVPKGKFSAARGALINRIASHSVLVFRDETTFQKLSRHRAATWPKGISHQIHPEYFAKAFTDISVIAIRLNTFLIKSHVWLKAEHIEWYIASFEFVYRRARSGRSSFWEAIERFPAIKRSKPSCG